MRRILLTLTLTAVLLLPAAGVVSAAGLEQIVPADCNTSGGCQSFCDIVQLAQNLLNDGIILATILSAILFAWAGGRYVLAGGDTGQIKKATSLFRNVVIGFVIMLGAWLAVDSIMAVMMGNNSTPWNIVCSS